MREHERSDHEDDAPITTELSFWQTGGGYLVFRVRREYHPRFDNDFVVGRLLVGVAEVEDEQIVREILRVHDYNPNLIDELPTFEKPPTEG